MENKKNPKLGFLVTTNCNHTDFFFKIQFYLITFVGQFEIKQLITAKEIIENQRNRYGNNFDKETIHEITHLSYEVIDELINNIIATNSNYFQIISKILNPKLKENLTESFMNKFFSFYDEQYFKSTILSIKLGIEQLDKKTLMNSKNYNNNYSEACA